MEAVSIFTVRKKIPLYKGDDQANSIELIELEEVSFQLVSQKDLYAIGDKAVYIQPDYCLSDIPLFESFLRPGGDPKKCILGSQNRIRAKKFTLHTGDGNPVYSNGIILPYSEVSAYLSIKKLEKINLTEALGIIKYEEPEKTDQFGMKVRGSESFPEGLYKTDETNIHNCSRAIQFPITLIGTEKVDGSSITLGDYFGEKIVCSRNFKKPFTYRKCTGERLPTMWEDIKRLFGGKRPDLRVYEMVSNESDDFVKYGKQYTDKLDNQMFIFRGELNGGSLKGSGNKNNPARVEEPNIKFFGVDICYSKNGEFVWEKANHRQFISVTDHYGFPRVKEVFVKEFNSFQEILDECNKYFKTNFIEGIVVRTPDSKFSAKVMNLEYDSKK